MCTVYSTLLNLDGVDRQGSLCYRKISALCETVLKYSFLTTIFGCYLSVRLMKTRA